MTELEAVSDTLDKQGLIMGYSGTEVGSRYTHMEVHKKKHQQHFRAIQLFSAHAVFLVSR